MKNSKSNELKIEFQIIGIDIMKFSYKNPENLGDNQPLNFNFNIQTENKVNQVDKLVFMIFNCEISIEGQSAILAEFQSNCVFSVINFDEVITKDESNNFHINNQFLQTINMVTISTSRGLMFSQFKGTFLHSAILPLIDPKIPPTDNDKNLMKQSKKK